MTVDPTEALALRRYALIAEAANPCLTPRERGRIVRAVAARVHEHPDGSDWAVCRHTLDRWLRAYQTHGLEGLKPGPPADTGVVRRHPELFQEAAALRLEHPARSAAHIADIVSARHGIRLSERTVREQMHKRGLDRARLNAEPRAFGRYEADGPNERWIGDVLVGPWVPHPRRAGSRQARLFLLVDDHSLLLVHGSWCNNENTRAGQQVLRAAITRRGLPEQIYFDNGAPSPTLPFANAALERTCAVLGIHLIHSKPYSPECRGKQERLNRVIRERFLLEAEAAGIADLQQLNDRFVAWAESYLNCRLHSETGQTPIGRFQAQGPPRAADPELLHLLSPAQLEELRLLTNADMDSRTPFAMLLVGQPTLARQLRMACSPPSTSASPPATPSSPWTSRSPPTTAATTWPWSAVQILSSPTTPSPVFTGPPPACPAPSTTPPSPP
jgi:putative transposase